MIVYPNFQLPARHGPTANAWWRTASWVGALIAKIALVIAMAAVVGIAVGAALGFVVVVAMI